MMTKSQALKIVKWGHIRINEDKIESRPYESFNYVPDMGRSYFTIKCPFCETHVRAYAWSINGGGKRCECGALFNAVGDAYHAIEYVAKHLAPKALDEAVTP